MTLKLEHARADYHCSHSLAVMADRWADDLRLSDIEPQFA
jgi:hypothetical protein